MRLPGRGRYSRPGGCGRRLRATPTREAPLGMQESLGGLLGTWANWLAWINSSARSSWRRLPTRSRSTSRRRWSLAPIFPSMWIVIETINGDHAGPGGSRGERL